MHLLTQSGASGVHISCQDHDIRHVLKTRLIAHKNNLPFHVRVGGPAAKNDMSIAKDMYADGIIAPMIESEYALSTFTRFSKELDVHRGIVIETRQGIENMETILQSQDLEYVDTICIGRSVLVSSYRTNTAYMNTISFKDSMIKKLTHLKQVTNIPVSIEGNINADAYDFLKNVYGKNLIQRVHTKHMIFDLNDSFFENYKHVLIEIEKFEFNLKTADFTQ